MGGSVTCLVLQFRFNVSSITPHLFLWDKETFLPLKIWVLDPQFERRNFWDIFQIYSAVSLLFLFSSGILVHKNHVLVEQTWREPSCYEPAAGVGYLSHVYYCARPPLASQCARTSPA
jgi:hypothetical protein